MVYDVITEYKKKSYKVMKRLFESNNQDLDNSHVVCLGTYPTLDEAWIVYDVEDEYAWIEPY